MRRQRRQVGWPVPVLPGSAHTNRTGRICSAAVCRMANASIARNTRCTPMPTTATAGTGEEIERERESKREYENNIHNRCVIDGFIKM